MTARILLWRRMGEPLLFLDLRRLRLVSARECLGLGQEMGLGGAEMWMRGLTWFGRNDRGHWSGTLLLSSMKISERLYTVQDSDILRIL